VVIYKKQGFYQLWWRNLAIKFSRADFLTFVTMSQVALHMVHEREVTNLLLQRAKNKMFVMFQQMAKLPIIGRFSINQEFTLL
jgi:hypothetical protein